MMKDNDHGLKEGEVEFTPLNENKVECLFKKHYLK